MIEKIIINTSFDNKDERRFTIFSNIHKVKTDFGGTIALSNKEYEKLLMGRQFVQSIAGTIYHRDNLILPGKNKCN